MITPSFSMEIREGRLRLVLSNGLLLATGEITTETAPALRALADRCDAVLPPAAAPVARDLFSLPQDQAPSQPQEIGHVQD